MSAIRIFADPPAIWDAFDQQEYESASSDRRLGMITFSPQVKENILHLYEYIHATDYGFQNYI
jgi:hypothetical protein